MKVEKWGLKEILCLVFQTIKQFNWCDKYRTGLQNTIRKIICIRIQQHWKIGISSAWKRQRQPFERQSNEILLQLWHYLIQQSNNVYCTAQRTACKHFCVKNRLDFQPSKPQARIHAWVQLMTCELAPGHVKMNPSLI